jgi:CDP-4-dehydro-6-deoxyglucose reductase, E3
MTYQVTIQPSGHQFSVKPNETLLGAALNAGFSLPYGCRNGACGACKGKVLAGSVDYGTHQDSALTHEDKLKGLALFCCAKATSDLTIEVKEVGAAKDIPIKTLPCRVERMEKLAEDVMALWLKLPSNERLQFLPGQYLDFLLKDGKRRSFSLANSPEEDSLLELHIRHVPGGQFTDHVFSAMKAKDIMRISGPYGSFFLRDGEESAASRQSSWPAAPVSRRSKASCNMLFTMPWRANSSFTGVPRRNQTFTWPACPSNGNRSRRTSASSRCCRNRAPKITGRVARLCAPGGAGRSCRSFRV